MKEYIGKINNFIFKNEETRFGIAIFSFFEDNKKTIVIKGAITSMKIGKVYRVSGELEIDSLKGRKTFNIKKIEQYLSDDSDYLKKWLSSDTFSGVGSMLANRIVDVFLEKYKTNIQENILADIDLLKQIVADEAKSNIIINVLRTLMNEDVIEEEFAKNNLNQRFLNVLLTEVPDKVEQLEILENDVYQFAYEKDLGPFDDIDAIALHFGMAPEDEKRISWIAHSIVKKKIESTGGTYVELSFLKSQLQKLFILYDQDTLTDKLMYAKKQHILYFKGKERVYTKEAYEDEEYIATTLFNYKKTSSHLFNAEEFDKNIATIQEKVGIMLAIKNFSYNEEQLEALKTFSQNCVQIVTGGPGTGKTTVTAGLIQSFLMMAKNVTLESIAILAPTGRAASRITESTGFFATTIHRFLRYAGGKKFNVNEKNPVVKKVLIVDESSMIDQHLFAELLRGVSGLERIVLIGDADQLPSVGYGNVFDDLIRSAQFAVTRLIKNNRQKDIANGNGIIELARAIQQEHLDDFSFDDYDNLFLIEDEDPRKKIISTAHDIVELNTVENITKLQLVTAMNGGQNGVNTLNKTVQTIYTKDFTPVTYKRNDFTFHVGDKVICIENNAELQIFNGDMGLIMEIVHGKNTLAYAIVQFGDRQVKLSNNDFAVIRLAYACTIHKTQGSEFNNVLVILDKSNNANNFMVNKKLLYTAITRAKDNLYIFADKTLFLKLAKKPAPERRTTLANKLTEIFLKEIM